jgi:hypothetical protein
MKHQQLKNYIISVVFFKDYEYIGLKILIDSFLLEINNDFLRKSTLENKSLIFSKLEVKQII